MNTEKLKIKLEDLGIDLEAIADNGLKEAIVQLFNLVEELSSTIRDLQEENQKLRDENNKLKGEQGKPTIREQTRKENTDFSSEKERKAEQDKNRGKREPKLDKIKITRTEECKVPKEELPSDAEFKGYEPVIVQDLKIETENIEFKKEVYYSPSCKKTYTGKVPAGYEGGYGPSVKSLTIIMKYACNMSEPKILEFFNNFGIDISSATISRMLIKKQDVFHEEKKEIFKAGLCSSVYQQADDTSARVDGQNYYTHVLCNNLYTAYFTEKHKDRLTILDILRGYGERSYLFNEETFKLLEKLKVSKGIIETVRRVTEGKLYKEKELTEDLLKNMPSIGKITKARILEAGAIASYHNETGYPVVEVLLCDDAPQFKLLTENLGLCWVHDGRHYKKLRPVVPHHEKQLEDFRKTYWNYYKQLLKFKEAPSKEFAYELSEEFDKILSTVTGYKNLDERIKLSKGKKEELLMVLKYPEIPLHNNEAELGARAQVRKRDVSLQTRTDEGTKANDTFLTIVQTAKKLFVNVYDYIFDRISRKNKLPSLAETIIKKANQKEVEFCHS
jgi:regulator of replication initiation timing